ncbi:hypothetical protein MIN45_P0872 [Methylomarinovum tepidoasis]|uniref:DUF3987 domain-containing protein n=1 Tax=Methylomarinovum tepidoasis TaxID=2840183 RepID=A0AAU9CQ97_9GAMM|nr:DUF3987 domain-containing protein [Methylomarinovum sp. IN45]BCX88503.1 hypothetical protein MIN45_P0872 [Methylomarinovum sp. IN45]
MSAQIEAIADRIEERLHGKKRHGKKQSLTEADKVWLLKAAESRLLNSPIDLPEYSAEALGPLAPVARAIADGGQMDIALAGQSVLGAAALCTQAVVNVETLTGDDPLVLYLLSIADSGDGKTLAENAALAPIRHYQRERTEAYKAALRDWKQAKPDDRDEEPPRAPYLLMSDATIEGIRRSFMEGSPSQGLFSSEAAVVLTGYGMQPEHKAKTAAELNALWDRGEISVTRGGIGRVQLYDRRLSVHLMIQPSAARAALFDDLFANIGFWPRFLFAWPQPAPPRKAKGFRPDKDPAIGQFWRRCAQLLPATERESCDDLPTLTLSNAARRRIETFFEGLERSAKLAGGRYEQIKPFALRASQQACRIAGVLAAYEDATAVSEAHIDCGIRLATYSLESWRAAFGDRDAAENARRAYRLFEWLVNVRNGAATETDMLKNGPKPRSRSIRDAATALLHAHGFIDLDADQKPPKWIAVRPEEGGGANLTPGERGELGETP